MQPAQSHLTFSLLTDFAEGRQVPDAGERAHLAVCRSCSADLAWLQRTLGLLHVSTLEEPSARAVGEVKALFRIHAPRPAPLSEVLAAFLHFDSARMSPVFALRSTATAGRQLLFTAGPYDVDLRITPAGSRWIVSGQLLGDGVEGVAIVEVSGHGETLTAQLSPLYEFEIGPLRAGRYTISVELADRAIRLPDVEIGA